MSVSSCKQDTPSLPETHSYHIMIWTTLSRYTCVTFLPLNLCNELQFCASTSFRYIFCVLSIEPINELSGISDLWLLMAFVAIAVIMIAIIICLAVWRQLCCYSFFCNKWDASTSTRFCLCFGGKSCWPWVLVFNSLNTCSNLCFSSRSFTNTSH